MDKYRVEILGKVPHGLTHNDVFATVNSVLRERVQVESVTKRRLAGNMVSVIAVFESESMTQAAQQARYAGHAVSGFSFDTIMRMVR